MGDWFRNTEWNEAIAAAFDARLGRARQKAQYLNIQAYTLLTTYPEVAAELCKRAIELQDATETARAYLYLGTALAVSGDVEGAIAALECAQDAQQRNPMHRTAAYLDQALLVAITQCANMYGTVLGRLKGETVLPFPDQHSSALIAHALIKGDQGEVDHELVEAALATLKGAGDVPGALPDYLNPAMLRERLEALVASQDQL